MIFTQTQMVMNLIKLGLDKKGEIKYMSNDISIQDLDNLLNIPEDCRFKINLDLYKNKKE